MQDINVNSAEFNLAQDIVRFSNPLHKALYRRIQTEKAILPFELLGRTLAYNPYPPRFKEVFSGLESIRAICISCFDYEHLEKICAFNANLIILDVARDEEAKPRCEGLECVGYLRHYTNALIVIKDCFIDSYQVLQAVVYGADGVMFNTESIALKELLAFAFRLGLMAFVEVTNLKEIKQAVLAKAEGFYLPNECFEELHPIIPKRKCLCTNIKERYCLESNQSESDIAHLFDLGVPSKSLQATRADFAFAHIEVI